MTNFRSLKKKNTEHFDLHLGPLKLNYQKKEDGRNKRRTGNERQGGGMAVWCVNSRTPPWFWHPSQMACQIGCRAQISVPGPRSWNITRVDAETPWPVGKHTLRPDCALISTAHPVIWTWRPTGNMTPLILSLVLPAVSLHFFFPLDCVKRRCCILCEQTLNWKQNQN